MPIFVLILVSAVALIAGLSAFFLWYLTEGRRLRAARAAVVLFDVLGVGAMLFLFASHRTEGWAGMLALPIFLGYVAQIIALLLTMLAVLVRAAGRRLRGVPYSPARRRVLKCAALYPAAGALLGSYGAFIERTVTVRRDYRIPIRNLPPEADGLVIAQISDVHLGAFFSVEELDALLTETAAGGADLLAVTGDLFDAEHLNEAPLRCLRRTSGIFRVGSGTASEITNTIGGMRSPLLRRWHAEDMSMSSQCGGARSGLRRALPCGNGLSLCAR